jgi:hypothetical protein
MVALTMLMGCAHTKPKTGSPLLSGVTDRSGRFSALRFPQAFEHKFSVIATNSTATVEQARRWIAADLAKAIALQKGSPRLDRNASYMTISDAGWEFRADLDIDIDSRTTVDKGVQFDVSVSWVTLYNASDQDLFLRADAVRDRIEDSLEAALDALISEGSTGSLEYVR